MKYVFKNKLKNKNGITIVSLVVAIAIIIILSTVTINVTFGDNGLVEQAKKGSELTSNSISKEKNGLNYLEAEYANTMKSHAKIKLPNDDEQEIKKIQDFIGGKILADTTTVEDENSKEVTIPGGFKVTEDSAIDVNDGIVISDGKNEFVWVPVNDISDMYIEEDGTNLNGSELGINVTTAIYSKLLVNEQDVEGGYAASKPGTWQAREPDILKSTTGGDAVTGDSTMGVELIKSQLGITGNNDTEVLNNFANSLVSEYKAVYESIKKYNGFYVGRYELTGTIENPTVQKGEEVIADQNWYSLKKACSTLVSTNKVQSIMIYGNQWDRIMNWIIETGDKKEEQVNNNSNEWGNYTEGKKTVSGSNEDWKANNIYDLAGNCEEATQEALYPDGRVSRGGSFSLNTPASDRNYFGPYRAWGGVSTRAVLYIK